MRICHLSDEEAARLNNLNILPEHSKHKHYSIKQALHKLRLGKVEYFFHKGIDCAVVSPKLHYLRVVGINIQRVKSNRPLHITPAQLLPLE